MKKLLFLAFLLIASNSCKFLEEDCDVNLADNGYDLEDLRNTLLNHHKVDSLEKLTRERFNEVYRLTWSNGWTSTVFFTIGEKEEKYHLLIDGYSIEYRKYLRKVIELEDYEWLAITSEIENTNFWCSKYYSGNIERGAMDGATFYLEGIKNDRYHGITWQYDKIRDRLLNRILKASNLLMTEPYIRVHEDKDSLRYEFAVIPIVNSKQWWLITDNDTVRNGGYGDLISMKIHKSDTMKIQEWKLLQFTFDGMINEIPMGELEIKLSRNQYE